MSNTVHIVASSASLLSGDLDECYNASDTSCEGGFAAVSALLRQQQEPSLVLPHLDKTSPFVHMHPFKWAVNLLILQGLFGWNLFLSSPSILTAGSADFSQLQSTKLPLLLTNAIVPPSTTWSPFHEEIHFDTSTSLAVLSIADNDQTYNWPQVESAVGALSYIYRLNAARQDCSRWSSSPSISTINVEFDNILEEEDTTENPCWIPVIYHADTSRERLDTFISELSASEYKPAMIVDVEVGHEDYTTTPRLVNETWIYSYQIASDEVSIVSLEIDEESHEVKSVDVTTNSLEELPDEVKDATYVSDITFLRELADEAQTNDPVVGETGTMPAIRDRNMTTYRRCKGGECEMGNLFTDALRNYTETNVTFITSGGLRGYGWEAGEVKISDLFGALPFPNNPCTGRMNGISLFRVLNYTTSVSTFQSGDTDLGGRLLQVSGMRYTYNTLLNTSRLVAVEVWNDETQQYEPLERLRLYTFATDSYLCGTYDPYPSLLTDQLVMDGEVPGTIDDGILHQTIVGDYLSLLDAPYETGIEGRLMNDTTATEALDLVQTQDSCPSNSYWDTNKTTCQPCPNASNVAFSDEQLEFQAESASNLTTAGRVVLVNREVVPVSVVPKSIPQWFDFTTSSLNSTTIAIGMVPFTLLPGENVAIDFALATSNLEAGTAQGTVLFGISNVGGGCIGQDSSFNILVRVTPPPNLNQLTTGVRAGGLAFMGIIVLSSLFYAIWVFRRRKHRLVRTLQPLFLHLICFGVFLIGLTILPLSIDDSVASQRGCSIACMATPWLLSMGLVVAFSALFSKLWRINKLFNAAAFRRIQVREKDVLAPFAILFVLNFSFMLTWTLVDPLRWERSPVNGSPWNSYGHCTGKGAVSIAMLSLVAVVNVGALLLACAQAFRARNISDEFSESKYLAIAIYSWFQCLLVGVPVMFLIDDSNPTAKYFLEVALIFAICMSMLSLIFMPLLLNWWNARRRASQSSGHNNVRVSGINTNINTRIGSTSVSSSGNRSTLMEDSFVGKVAMTVLAEVPSEMSTCSPETISGPFNGDEETGGLSSSGVKEDNHASDSGEDAAQEVPTATAQGEENNDASDCVPIKVNDDAESNDVPGSDSSCN